MNMSDFDKEFWETVAKDGPVPLKDLPDRINQVLQDNPDWIKLPDVDTYALYSGGHGKASMTQVAEDLAARSDGTIGIINDTRTGSALGDMTNSLFSSTEEFQNQYSKYVDFSGHRISAEYGSDFTVELFKNFEPASSQFASHAKGSIITLTPDSLTEKVYAQKEIPQIVKGLINGDVTHVNGRPAAEFNDLLEPFRDPDFKPSLDPENYDYADIKNKFDSDYKTNVRSLDLDYYTDLNPTDNGYAKRSVLDVEQADLPNIGASENARVSTPVVDDLIKQNINTPRITPERAPDRTPDADTVRPTSGALTPYTQDMLNSGPPAGPQKTLADLNADLLKADAAGNLRGFAADPNGNTSFLIDMKEAKIYTVSEGGVSRVAVFDNSQDASRAFGGLLREAGENFPDTFKGLPDLQRSLGALGNHIDDLGRPAWRKALGSFGDEVADVGGKATKILGPLGVAAAGYETYTLETKLTDFEEFGLVPKEAMLAYRGILTAHTAQATVDPTLVGGELAVQGAHDLWTKEYNISKSVSEALEPGSLLEDVNDARQWLDAQAAAAGMAVKDYAVDRWNNPEKIADDLEAIRDGAINLGNAALKTAGDAAETVGTYAQSRWDNPERLLDDAKDIGDSIEQGATDVWNWIRGNDEPSELEKSLTPPTNNEPNVSPDSAVPRAGSTLVPIKYLLKDMSENYETVQSYIGKQAANGTLTLDEARLGKMLSQTGSVEMFRALNNAGVDKVELPPHIPSDPISRMEAMLKAGTSAMREEGLTEPKSEYRADLDRTGISNEDYARAASRGGAAGDTMIRESLQETQFARQQAINNQDEVSYDAAG